MSDLWKNVRLMINRIRDSVYLLYLVIFLVVILAALVLYYPAGDDRRLMSWILLGLIFLAYFSLLVMPEK
mgnify:CR=1 FL=1